MNVDAMLQRLADLPPAVLYIAMTLIAALENFVPPVPADVVVSFGSFLSARRGDPAVLPFLAVIVGNVGGAVAMFLLGRRYGTQRIRRIFRIGADEASEARFRRWYGRFGVPAVFASRFLPGVRALVPPLAGAIGAPATGAVLAMALASSLWYGAITMVAYRVGSDWEALRETVAGYGRVAAISAGVVAALAVAAFLVARRRR